MHRRIHQRRTCHVMVDQATDTYRIKWSNVVRVLAQVGMSRTTSRSNECRVAPCRTRFSPMKPARQ